MLQENRRNSLCAGGRHSRMLARTILIELKTASFKSQRSTTRITPRFRPDHLYSYLLNLHFESNRTCGLIGLCSWRHFMYKHFLPDKTANRSNHTLGCTNLFLRARRSVFRTKDLRSHHVQTFLNVDNPVVMINNSVNSQQFRELTNNSVNAWTCMD